MPKGLKKLRARCGGQAMSEFVIMLVLMTFITLSLVVILSALSEHAWRMISLVAWEPFS